MLDDILTRQLCAGNGWRIADSRFDLTQALEVRLEPTRLSAVCSGCGETKRRILDTKTPARSWRHLDAWGVRTVVVAPLRRVRCRWCGIRVELVPWARLRARVTHQFETEILTRARDSSIAGVCRQLGVHWTTVMRLIRQWVEESAAKHFRRSLRRIGVDEVSYGRGQLKYLTIVWDHDRGRVVWIGEGREKDTLDAFFAKLGPRRCRRLACITMDMAKGYIAAAKASAPQADVVFDRFHIERHLHWAVDEVRKREFWRKRGRLRDAVRGKRFLLLRRRRRLHWRHRPALDALLALNRRLNRAYVLKEQFEHVWSYRTEYGMWAAIWAWRKMLCWTRLTPLIRFGQMLERHMAGVLAWVRHRLTNAALESNNSRVRGLSHRARGYRNPENLMVILYHASWQ
ncbi:MAG: ISL3 family transposase [Gammaproteobacteria bacterium]